MGNGTSIGRVRGLGSSHHGAHHWLLQRFTAVGNLVLTAWFAVSLVLLPDYSYGTLRDWFAHPVPATGVALLIVCTFWHARLGMQIMIEDYVHESGSKFAAMAALNLVVFGAVAFGLFCVARLALGAA
ncbi:MAG TPA: succinate dehydrogenase, hydrophobic membrane anchor protein [Novosphingobium sp.]|nr:succinate dehydrogenase, hydrophobic membrane anchor protein [Novosphingobium sp.]